VDLMKKWRCKVCGYIHEGPNPPEVCPVCGAPASEFEEITEEEASLPFQKAASKPAVGLVPEGGKANEAIFALGYGLYLVASKKGDRFNAQTANTVFQITSEPMQIVLGINKNNFTHECIEETGMVTITVYGKGNFEEIKHFGYNTGHKIDKFEGIDYVLSPTTNLPLLPTGVAYLDAKIIREKVIDMGTHSLYPAEVIDGGILKGTEPITYAAYRRDRAKPAEMLRLDVVNLVETILLEKAMRKYYEENQKIEHPLILKRLEGLKRSFAQVDDELFSHLFPKLTLKPEGFYDLDLYLKIALDLEGMMVERYRQFLKESDDEKLKELFRSLLKSTSAHNAILKEMLEEVEKEGLAPVFYCPVCGEQIKFEDTAIGEVKTCPKCNAQLKLTIEDGKFSLKQEAEDKE